MPKESVRFSVELAATLHKRAKRSGLTFSEYVRRLVKVGLDEDIRQRNASPVQRYILKTTLENLILCRHLLPAGEEALIAEASHQAKALARQLLDEPIS